MTANGNWTKEENLAYAAGFIDGEGSFNVYPNDRKNYPNHLTFQLEAGNTDRDLLASFRSVVGAGKVTVHPWKNKLRRKPMWGFKLRSRKQVHDFAVAVLPFLLSKEKHRQARDLIEVFELYPGPEAVALAKRAFPGRGAWKNLVLF